MSHDMETQLLTASADEIQALRNNSAGGAELDALAREAAELCVQSQAALARLRQTVIDDGNVFEALMDTVRVCSLGQITNALFDVGGQYRRSM